MRYFTRSFTAGLLLLGASSVFAQGQVCDVDLDGDVDRVDIGLIFAARNMPASGPGDPRDADGDGVITVLDGRACVLMCTQPNCAEPVQNGTPIADAGSDQTVSVGDTVALDGSGSSDSDGDPLTFSWMFVSTPGGSSAALSDPTAVMPTFVADADGQYVIELVVNDTHTDSAPDDVVVITVPGNTAPVADAGPDQTVQLGDTVNLDGSGSSDVDGDTLTFFWSIQSLPPGSGASLSDPTAVTPSFTADLPGTYVVELLVDDGLAGSFPDTVSITTANTQPVADAGPDQTVALSDLVQLDGSGSFDADGDPLNFSWSLTSVPLGSAATLGNPNTDSPTFVADVAGTYVAQLIVNDGDVDSDPDTVVIDTSNTQPVADAGPDQTAQVGDTVQLDGTGSFDADNDGLTFAWSFTALPAGSTATLDNSNIIAPTFDADIDGLFVVQLIVNDGLLDSDPDTTMITVEVRPNTQPTVGAGPDGVIDEGSTFASAGSFADADADTWTATVDYGDGSGVQTLSLNPDKTFALSHVYADNGAFTVTVTVTDDDGGVGSDTATVTVNNVAPSVDAGPDASINEGDTFASAGSFTEPGDDTWTATVDYGDGGGVQTLSLNPDKTFALSNVYAGDGTFTVTVTVTDDDGGSGSDTAVVTVNANTEPAVDAGPDAPIDEGGTFVSAGSFADADADTWTATIDYGDGGGAQTLPLNPDKTFALSHVYTDNGAFIVTVTVTDDDGGVGSDTANVTVNNVPPTVDAGPDDSIDQGDTFTSAGSFADPGVDDTWTATVDYGDGSGVQSLSLNPDKSFALSNVYADDGTFTVTVTVTDDDGGAGSDTIIVTVNANTEPAVDAGPDAPIDEGDTFVSAGSFIDADADTWTATVDYGDGGGAQALTLNPDKTFALSHIYTDDGAFTVTVTVTDDDTGAGTDTVNVTVNNVAPTVDAGPDDSIDQGDTFTSGGSFTDPGVDDTWTATVDYGDGGGVQVLTLNPDKTFALSNVYASEGAFTVTVTVTDDDGGVGTDTAVVTVNNSAPTANAGPDQSVLTTDIVQLDGSGSSDPEGDALTFLWSVVSGPGGSVVSFSDDTLQNPTATFSDVGTYVLQLIASDAGQASAPDSVTIVVTAAPALNIFNQSINEGDSGTTAMDITVSLSFAVNRTVTADYATSDGSATAGSDYVAANGTVTFPPNTTTAQIISIDINGDTDVEPDETFIVALSNPANATLGNPAATGTIENDDAAATISLSPPTINLFTGESDQFTVTLNAPALAGGQVVNLGSDNTAIATVPANVTVAEAATQATFPVTAGSTAGTAVVTASASGFVSGSSNVVVNSRAMSLVLDSPLVGVTRTVNGTVSLAQPAPPGGVNVTLASSNTATATVSPSIVNIAAGNSAAVFTVTGVSPGSVDITANASGFAQATDSLTVTSSLISFGAVPPVAPDQTVSLPINLTSPAPPGGVTVIFSSSDPTIASITPSVDIAAGAVTPVSNPQVTGNLIGIATMLATAPGFAPDARDVVVTLDMVFAPDPLNLIESETGNISLNLSAPAPSGGLFITLASDDSAIATVTPNVTVPAGQTSATIPVNGVALGSTILRANSTGIAEATATINVNPAPPIIVTAASIGDDLQALVIPTLGQAAPAGNLVVTLTSNDPARLLLALDPTTPGTASVTRQVNAGSTSVGVVYLQALDESGSVDVTVTAPGYATSTLTTTFFPSGFGWFDGSFSTTTFSPNLSRRLQAMRLNPGNLINLGRQNIRAGLIVDVGVTSSDPLVGTIDSPYQFVGNTNLIGGFFDPVDAGTTNLAITQPPGFQVPSNVSQTVVATVNAPIINVANVGVGDDLQVATSPALAVTPPVPTDVTISVADPSIAVISPIANTVGGADITLVGVTGASLGTVYVHGLQQGSTLLTIQAAGYTTGVATITVDPSGFAWFDRNFPTTTFSNDVNRRMESVRLHPSNLSNVGRQALRPGLIVDVPVSNSNPTAGTITSPYQFTSSSPFANGVFDPINAGVTILTLTQPAGFEIPSNRPQAITATVSAPMITYGDVTLGDDLQVTTSPTLDVTPPVPTDVTIAVADPSVVVISTDVNVVGGDSITLPGFTGRSLGQIIVQGLQQGTTTITTTATGYETRVTNVTVTPSGFAWFDGHFSTTTLSSDVNRRLESMQLTPGTLLFFARQALRAGATADIVVASSDPAVGTIESPYSFGANELFVGGLFDPLTAGTTDLSIVAQPAGFETPSNRAQTITATVNAPVITLTNNIVVGKDLQSSMNVTLQVAPPGPTDVTISVSSGTIVTVSADGALEGTSSIVVPGVTGTFVGNVFVQGRNLGSTLITAQAGGYTDGTTNVTVFPSGFTIPFTTSITTTAGAGNADIRLQATVLDPTTLNRFNVQNLRGGLTVSVNMSNSNPSAGVLTVDPIVFGPNTLLQTTQFDPLAPGVTNLTIQTPPGFTTPSNFQQVNVTVNP